MLFRSQKAIEGAGSFPGRRPSFGEGGGKDGLSMVLNSNGIAKPLLAIGGGEGRKKFPQEPSTAGQPHLSWAES